MVYLFDALDRVESKLKSRRLFIFLDFDGTLAPIADTPQKASLPKKTRVLLEALSADAYISLAFISGRSLKDLKNKIGLKKAIYAGNHGLEISGPSLRYTPLLPARYGMELRRIKGDLTEKLLPFNGVFLEDKGLTLSLHYRLADKNKAGRIKALLYDSVAASAAKDTIRVSSGKMVLEVRPAVDWDKARTVRWLLGRKSGRHEKNKFFPIYIGDDSSDEDAFAALKNKGLTVFVGRKKGSCAQYWTYDHGGVADFLRLIRERIIWQA